MKKTIVLKGRDVLSQVSKISGVMTSETNAEYTYVRMRHNGIVFNVAPDVAEEWSKGNIVELTLITGKWQRPARDENGDVIDGEFVETDSLAYDGHLTREQDKAWATHEATMDTIALSTKANMLKGIDATNPLVAALLGVATKPATAVAEPKNEPEVVE